MKISRSPFGKTGEQKEIFLYTLQNAQGMKLTVTNFGGRMVNLFLQDRSGHMDDVIMGFDTLDGYLVRNPYFGALVGRCANRIQNAEYEYSGRHYSLDKNAAPHHLHGGRGGFDKRVWDAEPIREQGKDKLKLTLFDRDGSQGYPGNLWVDVRYGLSDEGELSIEYRAKGDRDTCVNLTNHCYYNLGGHDSGTILDHILYLNGDYVTETDAQNIPTGRIMGVEGTPLDFRNPAPVGARIHDNFSCLKQADGYDVNYILNRRTAIEPEKFCFVSDPDSGRTMEGFTTLPAVQFYTANNIKGDFTFVGKNQCRYPQYCGFCLETQYYPDSPNHPQFPSVILKKGEEYSEKTIFRFGIEEEV